MRSPGAPEALTAGVEPLQLNVIHVVLRSCPGRTSKRSFMFDSQPSRISLSDVSRKAPTVALGMVVTAALGIGLTGTASAETNATVSLTVNGKTSSVSTSASTVAGLLNERDVRFDANDLLSPDPSSRISDGSQVVLTNAVRLTVVDDGQKYEHLVVAKTVAKARAELNLPTSARKASTPFAASTFERTGFYTDSGDHLSGTQRVREGSVAKVHDVHVTFPTKTVRVKHHVDRDRSKLVRQGGKRVYREGHNGRKQVTHRRVFVDKKFARQNVAKSRWLNKPSKRVVRVGTGPNWIGLARCESGGNPNAVNPSGFYGLYQFSVSTWHSVGGRGNPTDYGYWEQTKRAWILFKGSGRSPWPVCGRHL